MASRIRPVHSSPLSRTARSYTLFRPVFQIVTLHVANHEFVMCLAQAAITPAGISTGRLITPIGHASGVDLTFATRLAASSKSECQILNSTRNIYFIAVL